MLFEAIAELVGHVALSDPVVILLEDLHWADAMSVRLLAFLGRRIHQLPVLVVGTMRPEELVDAPVLGRALQELRGEARLDEIVLSPLSEAETRALGQALQPSIRTRRDRDRVMGEVWARSEGNPFVIVESLRGLGAEAVEAWIGQPRLTRSVQDFVAARLDRLGERPAQAVAVAAVIGREFPFTLLSRAAGMNDREAAEAVEELVRRRILDTVGDQLEFCHDWIRHVAYDRLVPAKRVVLHAAIGEALEALHRDRLDDVADQLGQHYSARVTPEERSRISCGSPSWRRCATPSTTPSARSSRPCPPWRSSPPPSATTASSTWCCGRRFCSRSSDASARFSSCSRPTRDTSSE